ncbi:MAG: FitA-like ribbon-helix-helix domain-containing protein [Alphaproteobacteria bacterium]
MGSITVRNLDGSIKEKLRVRAALNGHSMEAEVRQMIQTSLNSDERNNNKSSAATIFSRLFSDDQHEGSDDVEISSYLPSREAARKIPNF